MDAFLAPSSPPQDSGYGPSGSRSRRTGQTSSEESGPLVPVVSTRYRVAYPDLRPCPVECLLGPDPEIFVRHGQDIRDGANTILAEHGLLDGPRCFAETNMEQIEGRPGTEEPTVTIVLPWLPDSKAKWTSAVQAIAIRNKELLQDTEFEDTPPRIEITAPEIVGPIYLGVVDDRPYLLQHWDHIKRVVHERLNTFDATRHFVTSVILLRHGLSPNTATNPITVYISVDRRSDEKQWDSILTNIENSLKALGWTDIRVHLEHNSPCLLQFQLLDLKGERGEILSKISKNNLVIHGEYHDNVNLGDDVSISQYVDRDDGETCNPLCGTLGCYLEIKTKTNPQWTKVGLTNYHNVRPGFQGWTIKEVDGGSIIGPPSSNSQLLKVDQNGWLPGTVGDPTPFESPSRIKHNFTVWDLNQRIQDAKDTVQEDPSEGNVKDLADLEGELKRKTDFFNQNNQALGPLIAASGYGRRSVNNHRLDWALIQVPEHRQGSNRLPQKGEWTKYNHHSLYRPNAKTYGQPLKTQGRSILPLENRPSHLPSVANVWKLGTTTRLTAGKFSRFKNDVKLIEENHMSQTISNEYCFVYTHRLNDPPFSGHGDSGASVFDEKGCIVGLLFRGQVPNKAGQGGNGVTFVTPIEDVFSDIKKLTKGEITHIRVAAEN
ncbi:hypothetical protein AU210_001763 [Fusarium oxysporum f. sp. radicis-cucumerinum]|uniref:Peptidase S7 domain-containing protein n=2 Tax=Fusarium oxysporum TaxID=5507 RepID=A0A2H3HX55_FUSOX|nr:hypothetical protein AU210_001763 [Fusarium oxysporum f. sp. radicis-cucumerinum]RKL03660.1 hypothetical protein BFJ68_g11404 [Fusarium oxysporum]